jgi:uncharacterized protein (UPF0332 family)
VKETQALIDRANRYLKSAAILLQDGDCESCVSRAYYAMFFAAEAALLTKDLAFSSHKGVISGFGEHFIKTGVFPKEMGREFNRAFEKRQVGDYDFTFVISAEEARQLLPLANSFVDTIAPGLGKSKSARHA